MSQRGKQEQPWPVLELFFNFSKLFFCIINQRKTIYGHNYPTNGAIMAAFAINIPKGNENTAGIDFIFA